MREVIRRIAVGAFWLAAWALLAQGIGNSLILPSPTQTLAAFAVLLGDATFVPRLLSSQLHVMGGFFLGAVSGVLFGWLAATNDMLSRLMALPVQVMRAIPVASFVVFALFILPSAHLSLFIVFVLVFPLVYQNALDGRRTVDASLLEMARTFRVPLSRRLRGVLLPSVLPFLSAAFQTASGLAWKGGVAAEMIALAGNSVGEALFQSKITLDMPALFAWTGVILMISLLNTKLVLFLWNGAAHRLMRIHPIRRKRHSEGEKNASCDDQNRISFAQKEKTPLVQLRDVCVSFSQKPVLQDVTATLFAQDRVRLCGPSGVGKTTLLRVIAAVKTPDGGSIQYAPFTKPRCNILFQENRLLESHSVRENLRFVGLDEETIADGLSSLSLLDVADQVVSTLSGGMKRRLALLRALLSPGDLLLLDEPFVGLDEALRKKTADAIVKRSKGFSALVVCDHVLEGDDLVEQMLAPTAFWHLNDDGRLWYDIRQV